MANDTNTALFYPLEQARPHGGWNAEEDALLWQEVRQARSENRPLKSVFDSVAQRTGRKPNSIRNYYYARAKEDPSQGHSPAFVPFTEEEIRHLLITVLGAQARGMSVRACTLEMGKGDTRAMLRYQNKYRALLKTNPALVSEIVRYMKEQGMPCRDPYEQPPRPKRAPAVQTDAADSALMQGVANLLRLSSELQRLCLRVEALERSLLRPAAQNEPPALMQDAL